MLTELDQFERQQQGLALRAQAIKMLYEMPVADALGAACSFLFYCALTHRTEFRRVMNEKVIREGFAGISLLEVFKRHSL